MYRQPVQRNRVQARAARQLMPIYKQPVVSGRGAYAQRLAQRTYRAAVARKTKSAYLAPALGVIGGVAGSRFGKPGSAVGAAIGSAVGQAIHQVTGLGAYKVRSNILYEGAQIPKIMNKSHVPNGTTIRHKEYLCDIISSSSANTFNIQNFYINPGQAATFPWLSQIAQNYEEYVMEGCLFEFRSMSSDALNSVNTALGTVIMATEYNSSNANFASKAEMEAYEYSMSEKPSCSMIHPIECDPRQTPIPELYIRPGALPSGQDQRLYDLGNFQIATTGCQGTSVNLGELWVSYQVTLIKPKMYQALGLDNGYFRAAVSTGLANSTPVGTPSGQATGNNLNMTFASGTTIIFPKTSMPQSYLVYIRWVGSSVTWVPPTVTAGGSATVSSIVNDVSPASGATATQCSIYFNILCPGQYVSNSVVFGAAGTLPSSISGFDLIICQISNNAT